MKKDNLPIWPSDTNKGGSKSIEVYFLSEPSEIKDPKPTVTEQLNKCILEEQINEMLEKGLLNEMDVNENAAGPPHEYHHSLSEEDMLPPEAFEEALLEEKLTNAAFGHKGKTGWSGYVEEDVYELVLDSLNNAIPDAKESFREVVADGITKKITKYMSK